MKIIADDIYQLDKDIKDTLDSIIVGLELTTDNNFYYTQHGFERRSSCRKYYSFRRKHYYRDTLFDFYILSNLTLKIEINDGHFRGGSTSGFSSIASSIEELFDFELVVRGRVTDIYLDDYSELLTVVNILMKYFKFDT